MPTFIRESIPVLVELFEEDHKWGIRYRHLGGENWSVTLCPSDQRRTRELAQREAEHHAADLGFVPYNGIEF